MKSRYNKTFNKTLRGGDNAVFSFGSFGYDPEPVEFEPLQVHVYDNFERAFKEFRNLVQYDGILALYKEKQRYEKPSDKKRRKQSESIRREYEAEMKQKKIISGEYEKEKEKKLLIKEKKKQERDSKKRPYSDGSSY